MTAFLIFFGYAALLSMLVIAGRTPLAAVSDGLVAQWRRMTPFGRVAASLYHQVDQFKDEIKMGDEILLPISPGMIDWPIPVKWTDASVTNYLGETYHQKFEMSATGALRVSKFGLWAERDLFNVRNVSEGIKRCDTQE